MATDNRLPNGVVNPFSERFLDTWKLWKDFRFEAHQFQYKGNISEQVALMHLSQKADGSEEVATKMVMNSIEHGWAGIYPLKTVKIKENGRKKAASSGETREQLNDLYSKRFGAGG